jgi:hypothetical protein
MGNRERRVIYHGQFNYMSFGCVIYHADKHTYRIFLANRMMGAIAFTVPAAVYLYNSGPPEKEHGLMPHRPVVKGDDGPNPHGERKETEETPSEDENKPEEDAQKEAAGEKGDNKPSERDPVGFLFSVFPQ